MPRIDLERAERTKFAIRAAGFDVLICAHPKNVLMLAGYYPIIGNSIVVADREGYVTLLVPEDELEYSNNANANETIAFKVGELPLQEIQKLLTNILRSFAGPRYRIGIERGPISQEASYIAMTSFGCGISDVLHDILPNGKLESADALLASERARLTRYEQEQLRMAAIIAEQAFAEGTKQLEVGLTEREAAQNFERLLTIRAGKYSSIDRSRGMVSCMSGDRSGTAYGAFAMSSERIIQSGELILVHCNSHADGFWTDITRTYFIGTLPERIQKMYDAMLEASRVGIAGVKPGNRAEDVDRAVRETLRERGYGIAFKHSTGHGVGFSAIDHEAIPRLRKNSPDTLEAGMAMNIEPGIYFEGFGGMRQCNMVLVTENGAEVLTQFQNTIAEINV